TSFRVRPGQKVDAIRYGLQHYRLRSYLRSPSAALRMRWVTLPLASMKNSIVPAVESNRVSVCGTRGKSFMYSCPWLTLTICVEPKNVAAAGGPSRYL